MDPDSVTGRTRAAIVTLFMPDGIWSCHDDTVYLFLMNDRLFIHAQMDATKADWDEVWGVSDLLTVPGTMTVEPAPGGRAGIDAYSMELAD